MKDYIHKVSKDLTKVLFKAYDYKIIRKGAEHKEYGRISNAKLLPFFDWLSGKVSRTVTSAVKKEVEPVRLVDGKLLDQEEDARRLKGFYGTSLPLIPNIRNSSVDVGYVDPNLLIYGITKRKGTTVTLETGPNRALNRAK
jgi:hypothetical protein